MAKSNVCFFPLLNDDLYNKVFDKQDITFFYLLNNELKKVNYIEEHGNISFENSENWNCDDYDLIVCIEISLKNVNFLFGNEGIAPLESKIGLCIEWYSSQSKIREVIPNRDYLSKNDDKKVLNFELLLPKRTFNGLVVINALLYLAKSAQKVDISEYKFNNSVGVIIGNIFKRNVFMTGSGSLFPIKILNTPNPKMLWNIELNLDEPDIRQVADGLTIILYSAHKDYHLIDPSSRDYCARLADEIVTNALTLFLSELSKSPEFDLNGSYEEGTLLGYAKYCKDRLGVQFDSSLNILNSLHEYSERGD